MHNLSQGDTLISAKKVLLLILHHLPPKCLFNVITFGAGSDCSSNSHRIYYVHFISLAYDELFSSSQPKSKETVTAATNYIQVCVCMYVCMYVCTCVRSYYMYA